MFGPIDNHITADDRMRAYEILGFGGGPGERSIPESLDLAALADASRLLTLHRYAADEYRSGLGGGRVRGLTEYRMGLELLADRPMLGLTEVKRGRPNHGGREVEGKRTIVGTIHTHPWDVVQSNADVRNLIRSNDIVGGVVTYAGRVSLIVKHPDEPERDRSPFASELRLEAASLSEAPRIFRHLGVLGALSAAFDLPIRSARDPYISALSGRLGLLSYAGDVANLVLHRT
jgi:hypothetical protein